MDKAVKIGILAFAATLLAAGGGIYAREAQEDKSFECPMHEAMEKAGYNFTSMEDLHKAMHENGPAWNRTMQWSGAGTPTGCPMHETMEKNGNNMGQMHDAMHGNSTPGNHTGGCHMLQGAGMMQGSSMMRMTQAR